MIERSPRQRERPIRPRSDDFFETDAAPAAAPATAMVSHGPYAEALPVGGMTVLEIRRRFGDRLDIDPESIPIIDGEQATEDTVVGEGQSLIFTRRAGEKGLERRLPCRPFRIEWMTAGSPTATAWN